MTIDIDLHALISEMAALLQHGAPPESRYYADFLQRPELSVQIIDVIAALNEREIDEEPAFYSACIFALEVCISQLQAETEAGNKASIRALNHLMSHFAFVIRNSAHSLSFWLPVLNTFYEVHVDLSAELKEAYLNLIDKESSPATTDETANLNAIKNLIQELSDLSIFDIAENFFAQSYALPADLYADLVIDLFHVENGQEIAVLSLLHPDKEVRDVVADTIAEMIDDVQLNPISLSRLNAIKAWYPAEYHDMFNQWIKKQRKKGVVFSCSGKLNESIQIKASEIDGSGAQGIFIEFKTERVNRLGSLLFKQETGIKDVWITPPITAKELKRYYHESFEDNVMLRKVDISYLCLMVNHFLVLTIEQGNVPDLHLLEIQEELGLHFIPQRLDTAQAMEELAVQITPFTEEALEESLQRSKMWPKNKRFTESWFMENAKIDKLVNRFCSFVEGVKVCRIEDAMRDVFAEEMESNRKQWVFHFLWVALWLKSGARKREKLWQDSFFIAYAIYQGRPLHTIPIMWEICYQSVINSMETMHERRTHLAKE
ncbi:hypothetical protein [Legionella londiniensis]|uniref:Uncharacterized protein n=1 Tax=Legionella londiniensis TaxID=45068 RepID=A0A0W0VI08_9GAMM|nr:hypothetical protein [Legionella londiniensis]KTD19756.1 hypothetical protein Llon_1928 [Legionella londiniensis]STX92333.1 Uncharacterised protein [Legionella londiniensis]